MATAAAAFLDKQRLGGGGDGGQGVRLMLVVPTEPGGGEPPVLQQVRGACEGTPGVSGLLAVSGDIAALRTTAFPAEPTAAAAVGPGVQLL